MRRRRAITISPRRKATAIVGIGGVGLALIVWPGPAAGWAGPHAVAIPGAHERGAIAGRRWEISVAARKGRQGGSEPCMTAILVGQSNTVCGGSVGQAPLLSGRSVDLGGSELTVVAMGFPLATAWVRVWLQGRSSRLVSLKRLPSSKSRGAGIDRLSYGGFAFQGGTCLTRLQGLDSGRQAVGRPLRTADCRH
jgi:hypothetical protein